MAQRGRKAVDPVMPVPPPATATPEEHEAYRKAVIKYGATMSKREYYLRNKERLREQRRTGQLGVIIKTPGGGPVPGDAASRAAAEALLGMPAGTLVPPPAQVPAAQGAVAAAPTAQVPRGLTDSDFERVVEAVARRLMDAGKPTEK